MIRDHLPALIVVIPLLAGVTTALVGRRRLGWIMAMLTTGAALAMAIGLLVQVHKLGPGGLVSYPMGSWRVPWAIEYRVDMANAFVLLIVAAVAAVVTFASRVPVEKEIPSDRLHFFWGVWILCTTGLLGITVTGDAFNVYVLLEIASLSMYTLVAMGASRDRRALAASMNYVVLGSIGACFILLGIGYLYMVTGTLNMGDLAARLQEIYAKWDAGQPVYRRTVLTGFGFLMAGFSIKLALFPLHGWLPAAYTYAPSPVSALLSGTATKVGAYIALRFLCTIVGPRLSFRALFTTDVIMVCAALAVIVGSYLAIRQRNLKRMLAYSSVAQIGYIAMGIAFASRTGFQAAFIHMFNHALMKAGLFLALGAVVYRLGVADLDSVRGLGRRMPFTMGAFVVGGLGIIGVPLTAGFISKWYLVAAAIEASSFAPAVVVLIGSLLAVVYVWRVVEAAYFQPPTEKTMDAREAPVSLVAGAWILISASVCFGSNATLTSTLSAGAARALLGGGP